VTPVRVSALGVIAAALICAALNFVSSVWGLQIATAVPLVLFLPGLALVLAVDPYQRHASGAERLLWCLLASIATAIAGGLILNVAAELTRTTWLAYLVGVVVLSGCASMLRRGTEGRTLAHRIGGVRELRVSGSAALLSIGAVVLVAGALGISVYSNATSNQEHFAQLWIVPIPGGGGSTAARAEVGVTNYEGRRERFDVTIDGPGEVWLSRKQVVLSEGQSWTYHLVRQHLRPVLATLSLASRPTRIVDSVRLASPVR
jgi:uncharacterized membrane protein